jgi:cellulose synthase/poly-beta-1,6-N-acetylglucosamine synthase-like glycosyltransferase
MDLINEIVIWVLFGYVIAISVSQIIISLVTYRLIRRSLGISEIEVSEFLLKGYEPPISIVIPAYNEEATIVTSVQSMLQLRYADYEVVVVNDGSKDATLARLIEAFDLSPFPQSHNARLEVKPIRGVYYSPKTPKLRVIDKVNGGKADGINCGINVARHPLFCCVDADSILDRDALLRVVQPFMQDSTTVACGGTVRIANGCTVRDGLLLNAGVPTGWLARFQIVEYLRGFLFGRLGWAQFNGLLIISGAFGVMRRDTVIEVGGYRHQTIGEDMELIVRMHRELQARRRPYRIVYVPEPICWTEAPEDMRTLKNQRVRWQRGLCESLWLNRKMPFAWPPNVASALAFPYFLFFEWAAPIVEMAGYIFFVYLLVFHSVQAETAALLLLVALFFGVTLSTLGVLLDDLSFHVYGRWRDLFTLFFVGLAENFGYRQLNVIWRLQGIWQWIRGKQGGWGAMQRKGIGAPGVKK